MVPSHEHPIRVGTELSTAFQPIVSLRNGQTIGFEALTRGAAGGPEIRELFSDAERGGTLEQFERQCWRTAIRTSKVAFAERAGWSNLFINVLPEVLRGGDFLPYVVEELRSEGMLPSQVVVEVTEASRIDDYDAFRGLLGRWRAAGFRIAVDDAGAGHSGLSTIVELNPDFVKADRGLVRGLARHAARRAAVEALLLLTRRLGISLVAEGVETEAELMELRRLGVPYAQGYFLGLPAPRPEEPRAPVREMIAIAGAAPAARHGTQAASVGEIVTPTPTIESDTRVQEVFGLFESSRLDAVVLTDGTRPVGLVTRAQLHQRLSQRYGRELYLRRSVDTLGIAAPLVVDARLALEDVTRAAMERADDSRYDSIVVAKDGAYVGTISVQRLLEAFSEERLAAAREENPLTGLPGNPVIAREIGTRLDTGDALAVLYVDLDWFKAFNDVYGFHHGDRAIQATARVLAELRDARPGAFLGHVGGDDFVYVTPPDAAAGLRIEARSRVATELAGLYAAPDRERGYIEAAGRDGVLRRFPLLTATVAAVTLGPQEARDTADVLSRLAEAKRAEKERAWESLS